MRRPFLIALLGAGTFLGFGSGIFHLVRFAHEGHFDRREAFERHVADICAESAIRAAGKSNGAIAPAAR